jgi:AraC family transcriptional activator of mtrCDE
MLAPTGTVELHCRFAGPWTVEHDPALPGHVPYHVILQGRAWLHVAQQELELGTGDVLMFPHGARHTLRAGDTDDAGAGEAPEQRSFNGVLTDVVRPGVGAPFDMLCGTFVLGDASGSLLRSLPEVLRIRSTERAALVTLIGMMRAESEQPRPGGAMVIGELSTALFTLMLRALMSEQDLRTGVLALLSDPRLSRAVEAVLREPAQPWTIATLAELSHLSRATFARQFTQLGGMTPLEWVTGVRMELAARLLSRGGLSAGLVGEQCGYASEAAFGRVFKSHYGMGPGAYRRHMKLERDKAMAGSFASDRVVGLAASAAAGAP